MITSRFPRVRFSHGPTPLEPLERLTRLLGGPRLFIKRDDCTGLATGGNKARKLEFLLAEALAQRADALITYGAVQSNHARQTAAAAAKYGMRCHILLERRVPQMPPDYEATGNVFLDRLLGAEVSYHPGATDMGAAAADLARQIEARGGRPYVIPGGGSNATGALGYAVCAEEIISQGHALGLAVNHIVHATGSGGTQAGLVAGLAALGNPALATGISVRFDRAKQEANVHKLAEQVGDRLDLAAGIERRNVVAFDEFVGPGYGQATKEMVDAITLTARTEGILLDPVYSGKGMAGLIALCRRGHFKASDTVVFIHTGGSAALFAYQGTLA
jgi:L-cysteate sulfo-lyase